ncbi:cbb3-type cytochrome oxidase assembly protein [Engelhardtia mirabilis]|uniref:Cytochrome oxidase maturation protein cbb3-type n=1 Tax=Engelhardtia mirabilis TaxID=2528011 RepID=A0A518BIJ1_9BACT|nr:Cytochrome oxidase maturation protein cbb3-type [Planctomycetes bacterium Pla133]QDV01117.1 Cytochrome oxidase maturation protein cbb3-type [Planctomycetes bacterium Pla86]
MNLLLIVIPIAGLIVIAALLAFRWAVKDGQLDDLETPALRMLHDDEPGPRRRPVPDPPPGVAQEADDPGADGGGDPASAMVVAAVLAAGVEGDADLDGEANEGAPVGDGPVDDSSRDSGDSGDGSGGGDDE